MIEVGRGPREIEIQRLILQNEVDSHRKPELAMKLSLLLAATGDHRGAADLLSVFESQWPLTGRCELLLELGYQVCRQHRSAPASEGYLRGIRYLEKSARLCADDELSFVPHLRRRRSVQARGQFRLGWAASVTPGEEYKARAAFHEAHELEPSNPYYLAGMLGFEMRVAREGGLPATMATTIREGIRTCVAHAEAGIEMPYACFTAGALSLLLGDGNQALSHYSRAIRYCLDGVYRVPADIFSDETTWIYGIHFGVRPPPASQRVLSLLMLASRTQGEVRSPNVDRFRRPVLIVAGGTESLNASLEARVRPLLKEAWESFRGTVISGGTSFGVGGAVGDVARELDRAGRKRFHLVAYRPERLPEQIPVHPRYDEHHSVGEDFLPEQHLTYWSDLLSAGVKPTEVLLLGIGGGPLSALEYRVALSLGASVRVGGRPAVVKVAEPV
jgi:tetratricopeptide (TPR) repeat protein